MLSKFLEKIAASKSKRFHIYREGKSLYQSYIREKGGSTLDSTVDEIIIDTRLDQAKILFQQAIELSEEEHQYYDAAVAWYELAMVYIELRDYNSAKVAFNNAEKILRNTIGKDGMATLGYCYLQLSRVSYYDKNYTEGVINYEKAKRLFESTGDVEGLMSAEQILQKLSLLSENVTFKVKPEIFHTNAMKDVITADINPTDSPHVSLISTHPNQLKRGSDLQLPDVLLWLYAYSKSVHEEVESVVQSVALSLGRTVNLSQALFASDNVGDRNQRKPKENEILIASIMIIEPSVLQEQDFMEQLSFNIEKVVQDPFFRLFVLLRDITIEELRDKASTDSIIADLFDTTQIAESLTLTQFHDTLLEYISNYEFQISTTRWNSLRNVLARSIGNTAKNSIIVCTLLSIVGCLHSFNPEIIEAMPESVSSIFSAAYGIALFPLMTPILFFITRWINPFIVDLQQRKGNIRLILFCSVVLSFGSIMTIQSSHGLPWFYLSIILGVLLEMVRRSGIQAERIALRLSTHGVYDSSLAQNEAYHKHIQKNSMQLVQCPLLPCSTPKVFLSYTRSSLSGTILSKMLYNQMIKFGAAPFLDRASIPMGANWRATLDSHIGQADAFISILDKDSVKREWVAAELQAAITSRQKTGVPEIIALYDPGIEESTSVMLPAFRQLFDINKSKNVFNEVHKIEYNEKSVNTIAWQLSAGRFPSNSIIERRTALLLSPIPILLSIVGAFGVFFAFPGGFFAVLEWFFKLPFSEFLRAHDFLTITALISAFWLGFVCRSAIHIYGEAFRTDKITPGFAWSASAALFSVVFLLMINIPLIFVYAQSILLGVGWVTMSHVAKTNPISERK